MKFALYALFGLLTFLTYQRNHDWRSSIAIWESAREGSQRMRVHVNLGQAYHMAQRWNEALTSYERAVQTPDDGVSERFHLRTAALSNMAAIYVDAQMFDAAQLTLARITDVTAESTSNAGVLRLRQKRPQDALAILEAGLARWPHSEALLMNHQVAVRAVQLSN